jgi:hypothetical protein
MKQQRASVFDDAVPVDGRGKRSNETLLRIDERDVYLIEAAKFFPGAASDREVRAATAHRVAEILRGRMASR